MAATLKASDCLDENAAADFLAKKFLAKVVFFPQGSCLSIGTAKAGSSEVKTHPLLEKFMIDYQASELGKWHEEQSHATISVLASGSIFGGGAQIALIKILDKKIDKKILVALGESIPNFLIGKERKISTSLVTVGIPKKNCDVILKNLNKRLKNNEVESCQMLDLEVTQDAFNESLIKQKSEIIFLFAPHSFSKKMEATKPVRQKLIKFFEESPFNIQQYTTPIYPGHFTAIASFKKRLLIAPSQSAKGGSSHAIDFLIKRITFGLPIDKKSIALMSAGGLIKNKHKITALILGAGQSKRFGSKDKRLEIIAGQPLIVRLCDILFASGMFSEIRAVISDDDLDLINILSDKGVALTLVSKLSAKPQKLKENSDIAHDASHDASNSFADSIGDSLARSFALGILGCAKTDAIAIMPADLPLLNKQELANLIDFYLIDPKKPCRPNNSKQSIGHPVILPIRFKNPLLKELSITRESSPKKIINNIAGSPRLFTSDSLGYFFDIDTPADLVKAKDIIIKST